jgi:cardiolipin synthase
MLNLPNALTLLRIVVIPAFLIVLTDGRHGLALVLLIAAGITDAADGAIARLTHQKTTLGAYLDPLADKLLLVSAFITLAFLNQVPLWLTVLVISRDAVIVTGFFLLFVLTQRTMEIRPSAFGKAATFFQLFSVIAVLTRLAGVAGLGTRTLMPLFVVTGVVTTVAGLQYMYRGLVWVQRPPPEPGDGRPEAGIQGGGGRGK